MLCVVVGVAGTLLSAGAGTGAGVVIVVAL